MKAAVKLYGVMARFSSPEALLNATRQAREAGYRRMDAYAPYPIEGLAAELGMRRSRIPSVILIGGLVGAAAGFYMQYYSAVIDYPFNVGGRPLNSWPAFIPITFEMLILVASLSAFISMLFLNRLPSPNHPLFNVPAFTDASQDGFFLCLEAADPQFDVQTTCDFLRSLEPQGEPILVPVAPEAQEEPPSDEPAPSPSYEQISAANESLAQTP
jgi:hypothetical protein